MKKQRVNNAVIDLGTNSIRMLVFRRGKNGQLFQVNHSLRYTKLGQGLSKTGNLSKDAINRNLEAMEEFCNIAQDYDVHHIYVFATSAMREAQNANILVDEIKKRFNLDVDIIDGDKEAFYEFLGVSLSFHGPVLIFDIGGGSTELIYGDKKIEIVKSLQLGCLRCSDDFIPDQNRVTQEELEKLFNYSFEKISKALESFKLPKDFKLIGTGGTVTTLSTIYQELEIYDSTKVHNSVITYDQVKEILKRLISIDLESREDIKGLPSKRIDTIIAGTVIVLAILQASRKTRCTISDFDGLEGAAYYKFMLNTPEDWDKQDTNAKNS